METEIRLTKLSTCAGCGAKVGAGTLSALLGGLPVHHDDNLLVGYDRSDDAAVYRISDDLAAVETVDFFPPIVDDPYVFGQVAAVNALSDIYAMGGEPKFALNLLCVPENMPDNVVRNILAGGLDKVTEAGAVIAGGHSIFDPVPKYGLCVTGFVDPKRMLKNAGARTGDVLILTKPLGTGILSTARKADLLDDASCRRLDTVITTLNKSARDCAVNFRIHACTDVTGFGLMGHLCEMLQGSNAAADLYADAIDIPAEAMSFAEIGILPEGMYRNRIFAETELDPGAYPLKLIDTLFDPQTSGGLLLAVDPCDADALMRQLRKTVPSAQRIGVIRADAASEKRVRLL